MAPPFAPYAAALCLLSRDVFHGVSLLASHHSFRTLPPQKAPEKRGFGLQELVADCEAANGAVRAGNNGNPIANRHTRRDFTGSKRSIDSGCSGARSARENWQQEGTQIVLAACPALKNLTVEIDLQRYTDSPVRHFNVDIYGDDFSASVARNCLLLERFAISNSSIFEVMTVTPIETFTDASLLSLAELKNLDSVEIGAAVMCTGNGIIDHIRRVLELNCYTGKSRMLELHIGGQQHGHFGVPTFYAVVVDLLRCLSEISEEDFGAVSNEQKFEVFLGNPYHSRVSKQWSSKYMQEELRLLMKRVSERHPSVTVNASVNGVSGDSFSTMDMFTMDMFTMSWHPRDKDRPLFWERDFDIDYTEDAICDQPPELMNFYYEVLGVNAQDEGRIAPDEDVDMDYEDHVERNVWRC